MKLQDRNGVLFPAKMKFRSWIVHAPTAFVHPCTAKWTLVERTAEALDRRDRAGLGRLT
jgi:hypothetical protein